jgi:LytB protein
MMTAGRYRWWVVAMLWLVCLFNYADRQAIFSAFPLLKAEMGLSDVLLGIVGDLGDCVVVPDEASARCYDDARVGVVCQITTTPALAERVRAAIERLNPDAEVRFVDTICRPTRERQQEDVCRALEAAGRRG